MKASPRKLLSPKVSISLTAFGLVAISALFGSIIFQDELRQALPFWWKAFLPLGVLGFQLYTIGIIQLARHWQSNQEDVEDGSSSSLAG